VATQKGTSRSLPSQRGWRRCWNRGRARLTVSPARWKGCRWPTGPRRRAAPSHQLGSWTLLRDEFRAATTTFCRGRASRRRVRVSGKPAQSPPPARSCVLYRHPLGRPEQSHAKPRGLRALLSAVCAGIGRDEAMAMNWLSNQSITVILGPFFWKLLPIGRYSILPIYRSGVGGLAKQAKPTYIRQFQEAAMSFNLIEMSIFARSPIAELRFRGWHHLPASGRGKMRKERLAHRNAAALSLDVEAALRRHFAR